MKYNLRNIQINFIPTAITTATLTLPPPPTPDYDAYLACFLMGLIGGSLLLSILVDYAENYDNAQEDENDSESDEEDY